MTHTARLKDMLRTLREAKGMTQEQLATRVSVAREYISMLESGVRTNPTIDTLIKLADALEIDVGTLVVQKGARHMLTVAVAHIPTWLKLQLSDAARGANGMTYAGVGWHVGRYHPEDFDLEEKGLGDVTDEEIAKRPSQTLRRLFRSDEHPRADFVNLIPSKRRSDFLRGLVCGFADEPLP